jgi:hypothetical protein
VLVEEGDTFILYRSWDLVSAVNGGLGNPDRFPGAQDLRDRAVGLSGLSLLQPAPDQFMQWFTNAGNFAPAQEILPFRVERYHLAMSVNGANTHRESLKKGVDVGPLGPGLCL